MVICRSERPTLGARQHEAAVTAHCVVLGTREVEVESQLRAAAPSGSPTVGILGFTVGLDVIGRFPIGPTLLRAARRAAFRRGGRSEGRATVFRLVSAWVRASAGRRARSRET